MKKRFRTRRKRFPIIRILCFFLIVYLVYQFTFGFLLKMKLVSSNEEFLKHLLQDSNYHMLYEQNSKTFVHRMSTFLSQFDMKDPVSILDHSFLYVEPEHSDTELVYNDNYDNVTELEKITEHFSDPNKTEVLEPVVYIYNSHQLENYSMEHLEAYNITPNVLMAAYMLKEKMNKLGIPTIVEESNITEFMKINNWVHKDSYKASRFYILDAINRYPSLNFFIDLHRDALSYDYSTVEIGGKKYAKVLFVVGLEHDNYQQNLNLAEALNTKLKEKYPTLTRGVVTKKGVGVDGIYNQDIHPNMILLECGGQENSIEEVMNTMEVISILLKENISYES